MFKGRKKCVGAQFCSFVTSQCEVFVIYMNTSVMRFLILTEQYTMIHSDRQVVVIRIYTTGNSSAKYKLAENV